MPNPWLFVSKPLSGPLHDGSSVLVRSIIQHLDPKVDVSVAYFGDSKRPIRNHSQDRVIELGPMGHAPSLSGKARILSQLVVPGRWHWPIHWFFTPNRGTSAVVWALRQLASNRPMIQSIMSSSRVELMVPWLRPLDRIVTLSDHTAGLLIDAGIESEKVRRIYPGVEVQKSTPILDEKPQAARFQRILYAGDLDDRVARILVALAQGLAHSSLESWQLIIACREKSAEDARVRALLQQQLAEPIHSKHVQLLGTVGDIPKWLDHCGIQVFVADHVRRKVDLPLVILEGLAHGQVLISSHFEPVAEIFKRAGERNLTVGASLAVSARPEEWARTIVDCNKNCANLTQWSNDARTLVAQEFSADRLAKNHADLYAEFDV